MRGEKEFGGDSGWEAKFKPGLDRLADFKQLYIFDFVAEGKMLEEMAAKMLTEGKKSKKNQQNPLFPVPPTPTPKGLWPAALACSALRADTQRADTHNVLTHTTC